MIGVMLTSDSPHEPDTFVPWHAIVSIMYDDDESHWHVCVGDGVYRAADLCWVPTYVALQDEYISMFQNQESDSRSTP